MGDALLRAPAFGHVFQDDDGSAIVHQTARQSDGTVVVNRNLKLVELVVAQAARQLPQYLLHVVGFVISGADAVAHQIPHRHADAHRRMLQMQEFQETLVPHLQAMLFVEHAQTVRHVVERDVEALGLFLEAGGQRRFFTSHGQRLDEDITN